MCCHHLLVLIQRIMSVHLSAASITNHKGKHSDASFPKMLIETLVSILHCFPSPPQGQYEQSTSDPQNVSDFKTYAVCGQAHQDNRSKYKLSGQPNQRNVVTGPPDLISCP